MGKKKGGKTNNSASAQKPAEKQPEKQPKEEVATTAAAATTSSTAATAAAAAAAAAPAEVATVTTASASEQEQQEQQAAEEEPTMLKVILEYPDKQQVNLTLWNTDNGQEIRQYVYDSSKVTHLTAFYFEFDGKKLNEFQPFKDIEGIVDGVVLRLRPDNYNERSIRFHISQTRTLAVTTSPHLWLTAASSQDNVSISLAAHILRDAAKATSENQKGKPIPESLIESNDKLSNFYSKLQPRETKSSLKSISFNHWNPPPANRLLRGDLVYLTIETLENETFHVTGHTKGFYVNNCSETLFDPRPAAKPQHSEHLPGLLEKISPSFHKLHTDILNGSPNTHILEVLPTLNHTQQWCVPAAAHYADSARAEDVPLSWLESDGVTPGQSRDWNEDYQTLCEMPRDSVRDSITRDRQLVKFSSEFVAACRRGAKAIVMGNLPPINPDEPKESHMFIWNNIFYSFASDGREIFKNLGGDEAAHLSASNDLKGVQLISELDIEGIHTLATSLVDFGGFRLIAQAIVPGILRQNQHNTMVFGTLDGGKSLHYNEEFVSKLDNVFDKIYSKPHTVVDEEGKEYKVPCSPDCKGMQGADGRFYLLDLYRVTPADANYSVQNVDGEASEDRQYSVHVLRRELPSLYNRWKYSEKLRLASVERAKAQAAKAESKQEGDTTQEGEKTEAKKEGEKAEAKKEGEKAEAKKEVEAEAAPAQVDGAEAQNQEELPDIEPDVYNFNMDVFTPNKIGGSEEDRARDEEEVRNLARFLADELVPKLATEIAAGVMFPNDGAELREMMHIRGINIRYLGLLLKLIIERDHAPMSVSAVAMDLVSRCLKRVFRKKMLKVDFCDWATTSVRFLNEIFSACTDDSLEPPKQGSGGGKKKGKGAAAAAAAAQDKESREQTWDMVVKEAKEHFRFDLDKDIFKVYKIDRLSLLRDLCLKTGIQLLARDYDFVSQVHFSFTLDDLISIEPITKNLTIDSKLALNLREVALDLTKKEQFDKALSAFESANEVCTSVYGPIHLHVGLILRSWAATYMQMPKPNMQAAIDLLERGVLVFERSLGTDPSIVGAMYLLLGNACMAVSENIRALAYIRHAELVLRLCGGPGNFELEEVYWRLGNLLMQFKQYDQAVEAYANALKVLKGHMTPKSSPLLLVRSQTNLAQAYADAGRFKEAVAVGREALHALESNFGPENEAAKAFRERIKNYLNRAVQYEKFRNMVQAQAQVENNNNTNKNNSNNNNNNNQSSGKKKNKGAAANSFETLTPQSSVDELARFIDPEAYAKDSKKKKKGKKH